MALHARVAAIVLVVVTAGCGEELTGPPLVVLTPVGSTNAPVSEIDDIALISEEVVCAIDSYEFRVLCTDRAGSPVGIFGRAGEGPEEFRRLSAIERGPDGTVGIIDLRSGQLSLFTPGGSLVSQVRYPPRFAPHNILGHSVFGIGVEWTNQSTDDGGTWVPREVDANSGELVWERPDLEDIANTSCGKVRKGWPDGDGGLVFWACQHELVFLPDRASMQASVVTSPAYYEELPSRRDVDRFLEGLAGMGNIGGSRPDPAAFEVYADEFKETPKRWFLTPEPIKFDLDGRLWVATTRDRETYSYLDVWNGQVYIGTVRIRDRLLGYDLCGATFAALVERAPGRDGISTRAVDWYDISALDFGR